MSASLERKTKIVPPLELPPVGSAETVYEIGTAWPVSAAAGPETAVISRSGPWREMPAPAVLFVSFDSRTTFNGSTIAPMVYAPPAKLLGIVTGSVKVLEAPGASGPIGTVVRHESPFVMVASVER
jgi:hypothetical protein